MEITALKARLTSEVNDPKSLDLIGTPPPKVRCTALQVDHETFGF